MSEGVVPGWLNFLNRMPLSVVSVELSYGGLNTFAAHTQSM